MIRDAFKGSRAIRGTASLTREWEATLNPNRGLVESSDL